MSVPDNAMYFVWNGNSSRLNDIVMTSLPQISIPKKRYDEIYVDHRDSTIIESLGWEAYDISFDIAYLRTDVTIEDFQTRMAGFFFLPHSFSPKLAGRLYFSNDLQTYYEAQFLGGINFEYFYKYKTATVTFHVQPFKRNMDLSSTPAQYDIYYSFTSVGSIAETSSESSVTWQESSELVQNGFLLNRRPKAYIEFNSDESETWGNAKYFGLRIRCPFLDRQIPTYDKLYLYQKPIFLDLEAIETMIEDAGGYWFNMTFTLDFEKEEYKVTYMDSDVVYHTKDLTPYIVSNSLLVPISVINPANKCFAKYKDSIDGTVKTNKYSYTSLKFGGGNASNSQKEAISLILYNSEFQQVTCSDVCNITYYPQTKVL